MNEHDNVTRIELPESWRGDWELDRKLGSGSYSSVYRAVRKDRANVDAAVKIISIPASEAETATLRVEGFDDSQSQSYFDDIARQYASEIDVLERFKGTPHIVTIEDYKVVRKADSIGNDIFIRMELLTPLDNVIRQRNLDEQEIIRIGIDICDALELCESHHILHRDIKPANIFINDKTPGHILYKLGDFGISRSLQNLTGGLSTKGTPGYMAPEVFMGKPYDARADLYSLGITLYRLSNNNRLPLIPQDDFSAKAREDAMARRLGGATLPPPCSAGAELSRIILKACAFSPELRYASASAMKADLEALARGETPVHSVLSAGDVPTMILNPDMERKVPPAPQPPAPKKRRKWILPVLIAAVLALGILAFVLLRGGGNPSEPEETPAPTAEPAAAPIIEPTEAPAPVPTEIPSPTPELTPVPTEIPMSESAPKSVTATTSPDDLTREWFAANPETGAGQPYIYVHIPKDARTPVRNGDFFGWGIDASFDELHGVDFTVTRLTIRWFNEDGVAIPDWVSSTEEEIITSIGTTQVKGNQHVGLGLGMQYELDEVKRLDGVGISLTGTDAAGNVYEFRGYSPLDEAAETPASSPDPDAGTMIVPQSVTFSHLIYGNEAMRLIADGATDFPMVWNGEEYSFSGQYVSFETPVMFYGGKALDAYEYEVPANRYDASAVYPIELGTLTFKVPVKATLYRFRGNRILGAYILEDICTLAGPYQETVWSDRDSDGNLLLTDRIWLYTYEEGGQMQRKALSLYVSYEGTTSFAEDLTRAMQNFPSPSPVSTEAPPATPAPAVTEVPPTETDGSNVHFGFVPYGQTAMSLYMDRKPLEIRWMDHVYEFTYRHTSFDTALEMNGGNTLSIFDYEIPAAERAKLKAGQELTFGTFSIRLQTQQATLYRLCGDRSGGNYIMDPPKQITGSYSETVSAAVEQDDLVPVRDILWLFTWTENGATYYEAASFYVSGEGQ